jgi:ketosteroid isomerase-like protein
MGDTTPSPLAAESQTARDFYAAINRNDIPAAIEAFDPQIEVIEPADFPGGGTYNGLAAVKDHFISARGAWGEGSCEPQRVIVAGDKVIVFVHVRVKLKHEADWREGDIGDVFTFRNGKVVQMRIFVDRKQALEWAGAKDN